MMEGSYSTVRYTKTAVQTRLLWRGNGPGRTNLLRQNRLSQSENRPRQCENRLNQSKNRLRQGENRKRQSDEFRVENNSGTCSMVEFCGRVANSHSRIFKLGLRYKSANFPAPAQQIGEPK